MKKIYLFLMIFFVISFYSFSQKPKILIIESYHADFIWDTNYNEGLIEIIGDKFDIQNFYMDTKRIPVSKHQDMAEKAWDKYNEYLPDLVILADDNALKYLGIRFSKTKIPVVYLGINNNPRFYFDELPTNMTGVLERPLIKRFVPFLQEIMPDIKNVLIIFDNSPTSNTIKKEVFQEKNEMMINKVNVTLKNIETFEEWKNTVINSSKTYDALIVGLYNTLKNNNGDVVNEEEVVKWTSKNTKIPSFAFWDFSVGKEKTIGGFVHYGRTQGIEAGKIVIKILENKEQPNSIFPVTAEHGKFLFSNYQLKKYNIKLPDNIMKISEFID